MALYIDGVEIIEDTFNIVGMTVTNDGTKTTFLGKTGDYFRIGDASVTAHTLNSEDDLLVTGQLEVADTLFLDGDIALKVDRYFSLNGTGFPLLLYESADANAKGARWALQNGSGTTACVLVIGNQSMLNLDPGLFDSVAQPTIAMIEKDAKYASATDAANDGADLDELGDTGAFANAVVGDIVRITAGTRCTAGWYWITDVTGANDSVTLDRAFITSDGAVSDIAYVAYHDFTMLSADGICTRITDGAPDDNDIEIDRAGWLILDVGQTNGRLYWRVGAAWHYVDATAGLSMPKEERIDPNGKEFNIGDKVELIVDKINGDGSFHAMPYRGNLMAHKHGGVYRDKKGKIISGAKAHKIMKKK